MRGAELGADGHATETGAAGTGSGASARVARVGTRLRTSAHVCAGEDGSVSLADLPKPAREGVQAFGS